MIMNFSFRKSIKSAYRFSFVSLSPGLTATEVADELDSSLTFGVGLPSVCPFPANGLDFGAVGL